MSAMHRRAVRLTLFALLLAAGIAAGSFTWRTERRLLALEEERGAREAAIARLTAATARIAAAQQAYADHGQRDEATFARVAALVEGLRADAATLRPSRRPSDAATHLEEVWTAVSALTTANTQAGNHLAAGDVLPAADLVLGSSRAHVTTVETRLRAFAASEFTTYRSERMTLVQQSWMTLAGVAAFWVIGLLALVPVPATRARRDAPLPETRTPSADPEAAPAVTAPAVPDPVPPAAIAEPQPAASAIDLEAVGEICAAISQLTETERLPAILEKAGRILDARGMIIWMAAGDELFAATAAGYEPSLMRRLRPIARTAENVTAAAWREGALTAITGDGTTLGAIAAPMLGATACIGVLAAEVRNGRENDAATRAAASIIASQLATVLSAWPTASADPKGAVAS
jgi:hypothetical protein